MESHFFLRALLMWFGTVWTSVDTKEINQEFSCCNLPIKVQLNRRNVNEFSIKSQSVAIATSSVFQAKAPFSVHGNTILTLDECKDFDQKIVFDTEKGSSEENMIHHHSLPCNRTVPTDDPLHGRNTTAAENRLQGPALAGVIVTILVIVLSVIGAIFIIKKKQQNANNSVV